MANAHALHRKPDAVCLTLVKQSRLRRSRVSRCAGQVVRHRRQFVGLNQTNHPLQVDTVDDDFRIVWRVLAVERDDLPVILNRRIRRDATDNSYSFHN